MATHGGVGESHLALGLVLSRTNRTRERGVTSGVYVRLFLTGLARTSSVIPMTNVGPVLAAIAAALFLVVWFFAAEQDVPPPHGFAVGRLQW
jgi:hypothetical protein